MLETNRIGYVGMETYTDNIRVKVTAVILSILGLWKIIDLIIAAIAYVDLHATISGGYIYFWN